MEEKGGQAAGDKVSQSMNRPSARGAVIEGVEGHRFLQKLSQSLVCMCVYIHTHTGFSVHGIPQGGKVDNT